MGGETHNDFVRTLINLSDDRLQRDYLNVVEQTEAIAQTLPQLSPERALRTVRLGLDVDLGLGSTLAGSLAPELQPQAIQMILDLGLSKVTTVTLLKLTGSAAALPYLQLGLENDSDYFEALRLELGCESGSIAPEPYLAECGIEQEPFAIETHRLQIAGAIAAIEHPDAAQLLQKHLGNCNTQNLLAVYTRYNILRQLEYCPNSQAIVLLLDLIQQPPNWMLHGPCLHRGSSALLNIGERERRILESILQEVVNSPPERYHIYMAMEGIGLAGLDETATVKKLANCVDGESRQSRWSRQDVLKALAKLGGPMADELIRHSLCHPSAVWPHITARLYRERWGSQQGALEVAKCLAGDDPWVQQQALKVLRYLVKEDSPRRRMSSGAIEGGIMALEILEQRLDAPTQANRVLVAQLLTELITDPSKPSDYFHDIDYSGLPKPVDASPSWDCLDLLDQQKVLHVLTTQFDEQDLEQGKATLQALAWLREDASKPMLLETLRQASEPIVRGYAGRALGYFRDRDLLPILLAALKQETDPEARAHLAVGLCHYTEIDPIPSALEAVFLALAQETLDSPDREHVRALHGSVPFALGQIGGEKAIGMLEQLMRRYGNFSTIHALGRIANAYTVELLSQAFAETLQSYPYPFYDGEELIKALAKAGTPQAFEAILAPLPHGHSDDTHTRLMLMRHGKLEHVPRLWEVVKCHRSTGFHRAIAAIQERCGYYNPNFMTTDSPAQTDSNPSPT